MTCKIITKRLWKIEAGEMYIWKEIYQRILENEKDEGKNYKEAVVDSKQLQVHKEMEGNWKERV